MSNSEQTLCNLVQEVQNMCKTGMSWRQIHNQVFGEEGFVRTLFPTTKDKVLFYRTEECETIKQMIKKQMIQKVRVKR